MDTAAKGGALSRLKSIYSLTGEGVQIEPVSYLRHVFTAASVALTLYVAWYALFAPSDRHLHGALFMLAMMPMTFATVTMSKAIPRITLFDYFLALLSFGVCLYFVLNNTFYQHLVEGLTPIGTVERVVSLVTIALVVEASRRCIGWGLTGVVILLLAYVAFGAYLPGELHHEPIRLEYFVTYQTVMNEGVFGGALQVAATYAFLFVLFGSFFQRAGGGDLFFNLAAAVAGRTTGGPAKACVVSSGLYGSISGSPVADVVTTGPITIALMKKTGVSSVRAGAIEAAASSGGAILPPVMGAVAFLMVEFTGIPYHEIALASMVPALLYYFGVFVLVHFEAQRFGEGRIAEDRIVSVFTALQRGWVQVIPIIALIYLLIQGYSVPYIAAGSTVAVIVSSWFNRDPQQRIGPKAFLEGCTETALRMAMLTAAVLAAGVLTGCVELSGLEGKFSLMLHYVAGENLIAVLVVAAMILILLGMGMPTPGVYIMGVALLAPVLIQRYGVPMLETHLFMLYMACLSAITPPVAVACFASATIARANPMSIAFYACKLGIGGFIMPFYFVYNPGVLMQGTPVDVIADTLVAIVLVVVSSLSVHGWIGAKQLAWWQRLGLAALSAAMIYPHYEVSAVAAVLGLLAMVGLYRLQPMTRAA